MKNLYIFLFLQCCFCSNNILAQHAFGEIQGKVSDAVTGETIPFAEVTIKGNGEIIEVETDFDGYFAVNGLLPGLYQVKFDYVGAAPKIIENVLVRADESTSLNIWIPFGHSGCGGTLTTKYKAPLLKSDRISTGKTFTKEEIQSLPTRNIEEIASFATNPF